MMDDTPIIMVFKINHVKEDKSIKNLSLLKKIRVNHDHDIQEFQAYNGVANLDFAGDILYNERYAVQCYLEEEMVSRKYKGRIELFEGEILGGPYKIENC